MKALHLSSTGALASINATGFVVAGCHGTGWNQQTVSDLVYAVEFVAADGQLQVFSEETTPDEMPAVRVNLGTLGIITKLTLRVEPLYNLHDEEIVTATESVMGPNPNGTGGEIRPQNLHKLLTENDYVELFWFPGSGYNIGQIWIKKINRTQDEPRDIPLRPDENWQYITPHVDVKSLYPDQNLQKFNNLRRQLDPHGMFLNPFLSQQGLFS